MHWTGKVSSVAFEIFGKEIAWYGIIATIAMLTGLAVGIKRVKRLGLTSDDMLELFMLAIPIAILFARLGYVVVRPAEYFDIQSFDDIIRIFAIWDGGLTIMTAIPGGVLGGFIWSKWRKIDLISVGDLILPVVLLSQGIGRWGNFFNQEVYGAPITDKAWQWFPIAVFIAARNGFYQATFFYEVVLNLLGFVILIFVTNRLKVKGAGTILYFVAYPFIRFILEFMRDDGDLYAKFNYTQLGCILVTLAAAGVLIYLIRREMKKGKQVWYSRGIPQHLLPKLGKGAKNA